MLFLSLLVKYEVLSDLLSLDPPDSLSIQTTKSNGCFALDPDLLLQFCAYSPSSMPQVSIPVLSESLRLYFKILGQQILEIGMGSVSSAKTSGLDVVCGSSTF